MLTFHLSLYIMSWLPTWMWHCTVAQRASSGEIAQVQILTSSLAKDTIQAYNIIPPPLSLNFFTCKIGSDNGVLVKIKCIYVMSLEQFLTLTCSKSFINISKWIYSWSILIFFMKFILVLENVKTAQQIVEF